LRLTVAAAPEIAAVLAGPASAWAETARGGGGECVVVDVRPRDPAEVAMSVATDGGVALPGLTPPASPAPTSTPATTGPTSPPPAAALPIPDVWVPDSTSWLLRVGTAAPSLVPLEAHSIATSPVVLAVPEPVAQTLGWPTQVPTWNAFLQQAMAPPPPGQGPLQFGIVEPNRDAAGLASLVALGAAASTLGPAGDAATVAIMRSLFTGRAPAEADLLARFPTEPAQIASALGAAPLSERALLAYNAGSPAVRLAALYVRPAPPALDYPYAVMPGITPDRARLAEELGAALDGADDYVSELGTVGLRGPDGTATFPAMPGSPAIIGPGQLDGPTVTRAIATWISVTRPARMLAVIDVSGSMGQRMPNAGGATRAEVALEAARQGLQRFDDSWAVGLWTFSTNLDGPRDYRELLPIRPMTVQRPHLLTAIETIQPVPNGDTGLYDTVLAAYQTVQDGWDPHAVNSVVLFTDGENDDAVSLTLDELIASLRALIDRRYPVQVIAIGIGDDVNRSELERITNTTGGGTFVALQPADIGPIFLQALSLRPPAPPM
jgi:hypothetical protein